MQKTDKTLVKYIFVKAILIMGTHGTPRGQDTDVVVAYCVNVIEIVKILEEPDDKQVVDGLSAKAKWCASENSKSNWDKAYYACSLHLLNTAKRSVSGGKAELEELLELKKIQEMEERRQEKEDKEKAKAQKNTYAQKATRKSDRILFKSLKDE